MNEREKIEFIYDSIKYQTECYEGFKYSCQEVVNIYLVSIYLGIGFIEGALTKFFSMLKKNSPEVFKNEIASKLSRHQIAEIESFYNKNKDKIR